MIQRERRGSVEIVRLAHGRASALDVELCRALAATLDELERTEVPAVVLTGTEHIFSVGVDLFQLVEGGREYVVDFVPALVGVFRRLFTAPFPVVGAVNGHAVAGGAVVAACCDYRLMARGDGRIGVAELKVGVPYPLLALEIVRFALPARHFEAAVYFGETYDPETALSKGFVDELTEAGQLLERACGVAERLAAVPRETFRITKRAVRWPVLEHVERVAPEIDAVVERVWSSPDTARIIRDYLERTVGKRSP